MGHFFCCLVVTAGLAGAGWCRAEVASTPVGKRMSANDALALRAEKMNEAYRIERRLRLIWTDPAYTSEEIAGLRAKRDKLRAELDKTEWQLRRKVEELPQVKALREQAKTLRRNADILERQAKEQLAEKPKPGKGAGKETEK